jgi:hypothetical protein
VEAILRGVGYTFPWGHLDQVSLFYISSSIKHEAEQYLSQIPGRLWLHYSHSMKISLLSAKGLVSVIDLYNVQSLCAYNQPKVMHHL